MPLFLGIQIMSHALTMTSCAAKSSATSTSIQTYCPTTKRIEEMTEITREQVDEIVKTITEGWDKDLDIESEILYAMKKGQSTDTINICIHPQVTIRLNEKAEIVGLIVHGCGEWARMD